MKYVRRFSGFFDPLPPSRTLFMQPISTVVRKIGHVFDTPPPPQRVRTLWMVPNEQDQELLQEGISHRSEN